MLKAKYIVYLLIYTSKSCICKNYTASHFKFGQELLGLTLRVNSLGMHLGPWSYIMCVLPTRLSTLKT